ncbi:hypothetical protein ADL02_19710 [Streptomyces sp. NRRL WC-3723]|nr:hypothetical protein ADL02_19710 [Streptomyces sp. NRRL WC-3723]
MRAGLAVVAGMALLSVLLFGWGEERAVVGLDLEGGAQALVCGGPHFSAGAGLQLAEVRPAYSGGLRALGSAEAEFFAACADGRPCHLDGGLGSLHASKIDHGSR